MPQTTPLMDKAVILARGLGTRMRRDDAAAHLTEAQRAAARTGLKAMIDVGRPFLDYVLAALADAGYRRVCLVIGPEHTQVRTYYTEKVRPTRLTVEFAIQAEPRGTADAVAAAEAFAGDDPFLILNSDNYYPAEALAALRELTTMGLAAFDQDSLIAGSNIPAERIGRFAVLEVDAGGWLRQIVEKPEPEYVASLPRPLLVSMNCWRFGPAIFPACRAVAPSVRGELELTDAVRGCIEKGQPFRALPIQAPVLDLSSQSDIGPVSERLQQKEIVL